MSTLLHNFRGKYKGTVQNSGYFFINLYGYFAKAGFIDIKKEGNNIAINTKTMFGDEKCLLLNEKKLEKYFTNVTDTDINEKRVSFGHYSRVNYGFFDPWLGGLNYTMTTYQIKFRDDEIHAMRVQEYSTINPSKITYSIEISDIERIDGRKPDSNSNSSKNRIEKKTDWNF